MAYIYIFLTDALSVARLVPQDGVVLILHPVVPATRFVGHAHPSVGVIELRKETIIIVFPPNLHKLSFSHRAIEEPSVASPLLSTELVLVAAVGLGHPVSAARVAAGADVVHVHLVLNHALNLREQ